MSQRLDDRDVIAALWELAKVVPDEESADQAIEAARAAMLRKPGRSGAGHAPRRVVWKLATAAAILGVLALIAQWLGVEQHASSAFAQVQQSVAQAKTVQYVQKREDRLKDGTPISRETRKVRVLDGYRVREEVTYEAGKPPEGEAIAPESNYVIVTNYRTGRTVTLVPDRKEFSVVRELLSIDLENGAVATTPVRPVPMADFYEQFRAVPLDTARRLPDQSLHGKPVQVFEVEESVKRGEFVHKSTRTYLIDPESKRPLEIRVSLRSTNPRVGDTDFVQSKIVFDGKLEESLFSTDAPPDYHER